MKINHKSNNNWNIEHYSNNNLSVKHKGHHSKRNFSLRRVGMKGDKIIYQDVLKGIYISKSVVYPEKCFILLEHEKENIQVDKKDVKFLKK